MERMSSLYEESGLDCRGIRDLCVDANPERILSYVGGKLAVGKQSWLEVKQGYLDIGFDCAALPGTRIERFIAWPDADFAVGAQGPYQAGA